MALGMKRTMPNTDNQSVDMALWHCDTEPVHKPGLIQPHGALIAVDTASGIIEYASENTHRFLHVDYTALLGQPLGSVFGSRFPPASDRLGGKEHPANGRRQATMHIGTRTLSVSVAAAGTHTIYEFEAADQDNQSCETSSQRTDQDGSQLSEMESQKALLDLTVELLRNRTGYDRVMAYQFGADGHGDVLSECVAQNVNSYLNLRFPAWDIPAQARDLMRKLPFRYIADVGATPVAVTAARSSFPALDMTYSHLRATSPVHLEYLRNMGAAASLTLNLVVRGELWGMIAMHHTTPRALTPQLRQFGVAIAKAVEIALFDMQKAEQERLAQQISSLAKAVRLLCTGCHPDAQALLRSLCSGFNTDGVAFVQRDQIIRFGTVPSDDEVSGFQAFAESTENLKTMTLRTPNGTTTAVLVVRVSELGVLAFFRTNKPKIITWAGRPTKITRVAGKRSQLAPRTSFEPFQEQTKDLENCWTDDLIEMARSLRRQCIGRQECDHLSGTDDAQSKEPPERRTP